MEENRNDKARLLDTPEDFRRLGVNPDKVEIWEDGRRNPETDAGNWEWWYFDSILDDGTKVVIQFFTKAGMRNIAKNGDVPSVTIKITEPDGKVYSRDLKVRARNCRFGADRCDVHIGPHSFVGDFTKYHIHVDTVRGLGADLELISKAKPYRPGTAYFGFGDDEYYTWLCSVPRGEVSGALTIGGKKKGVQGTGYHDHQWGNRFYLPEWNNWLWARQSFKDYSILIFDFITSDTYGFKRFPILFVQDGSGNLVFENRQSVHCDVDQYYTESVASGKEYPDRIRYSCESSVKKLEYFIGRKEVLEARGFRKAPWFFRQIVGKQGLSDMSYARFYGTGRMKLMIGEENVDRSGNLIYEFMFPGKSCKGLMESR
ncbi:MAG: lipocalin-like domain-containing protein [Eubacteriaceae bacterium]